ncbi:helicase-related protein [Clostridium novyi]|uniref:Helicase, SNF2/RAD54 family, putative n=1 Tax=Clostridium novyi (strain NT) TaxID=386415 RepID=A0PYD2_CLONN|nr:helicase-related protein [Clostridium novyi]ABK61114.1 helicase, SNF2/RAD54 family, putative [Clostridium novyi NT]KEH86719.1 helicase SNF2 [Clostridium novyi A str. NCTC 538]
MAEIPEIIDNRKYKLKDVINQIIKYSVKARIAAGYFYLNGFELVKENIGENCTLDIIIGTETDELTAATIEEGYAKKSINPLSDYIAHSMEKSFHNINEEQEERIYDLSEMIKAGRVNFKIYTKEKFHSKAYIFDVEYNDGDVKDSYAIIGSSNFTKRGFGAETCAGSNTELNAVLRQHSAINEVKKWYEDIWNESEDFNMELLDIIERNLKVEKLTYSPMDIILKTLYNLYKDDNTFEEVKNLNLHELTEFQAFAVKRAIRILNKYNGVIIADSVGLGKTYVAKGLLKYFENIENDTLIICPASLKNMWTTESKNLSIGVNVISQESIGVNGIDFRIVNNVQSIIIDEAHNFRNENASRFKELIKGTMGKKIVELTATPINNSIFDLYNIMTLFVKEDEFKEKFGIPRLRDLFNNYPQNKDKVENILSEILIRRSRSFIRKKYGKNNELIINCKKLKFPSRKIENINYSIANVYGSNLYEDISEKLQNLNLPVITDEKLSSKQIALMIGLIRKMFLKRLESSIEAFRESIKKQIKYCDILIDSINQGYLVSKKYIMSDSVEDFYQIDEFNKIELSQYDGDVEKLISNIKSDYYDFKYILEKIENINEKKDAKLQMLINKLQWDLKGKKVIIFTEFKDTAKYIYNYIKNNINVEVAELDSSNKMSKIKIVNRFAPKANNYELAINEKEIDVLVSTDVLAEGQNLQDCNIIINYDLSWNPVKIIQREGRIDRITTEFDKIFIYNFMPEDKLENLLNLVDKINIKIKYINETVGNESKILTSTELTNDKIFNDEEDTETLRKLKNKENKSEIINDIENKQDNILPSEEEMQEDYKNYLFNNTDNIKKVNQMGDGIYSIKTSTENKGIYMYYKVGKENYLLFYDILTDEFITNKAKIYSIISSGNFLEFKPIRKKIPIDVEGILEKGRKIVCEKVQDIIQSQIAPTEIGKVQREVAERIENMFLKAKYRSRITSEQRLIRKKIRKPLHKGTIMKLKSLKIEQFNDDELMDRLDEILSYIDLDQEDKKLSSRDEEVKLVCYEILL